MVGDGREKTALGIARERFLDALPRKSKELKGSVAALIASPDVARLREEMRRRLHALYASAQVFREDELAGAVKHAIECLDRARDEQRPLNQYELDFLTKLAKSIPDLGSPQKGVPSVTSRFPALSSISSRPRGSVSFPDRTDPLEPRTPAFEDRYELRYHDTGSTKSVEQAPKQDVEKQIIVSILLVEQPEAQAEVRAMLPTEQFEVLATADPEQALRLARSSAPDLVLAERNIIMTPEIDFIGRLRSDPLTDFVPVILILSAESESDAASLKDSGVDDTLVRPIEQNLLIRRIIKHLESPKEKESALKEINEATVDDVADRVSREIRRGLTESLRTSRNQKIPVGDDPEILAATWSTIGRIRSLLSHRSGGSVKFRDLPVRGGPSLLALSDLDSQSTFNIPDSYLKGRKILVADDDPAVLWFFVGLLTEEKATVYEATNGREALTIARNRRPELVISDILMPEIDGYTLCRELKKDILLADVPVILISWKEDFIQRMRELSSGASGYLRKEAGSRQILEKVYSVMRPRIRLEEQLKTGSEVRGRVEGIGILNLLEIAAKERPDSRTTVRDARNLFEIDIRKGNLVALTQTASDGSFLRGEPALQQLLGTKSGRYTITESNVLVRNTFFGPLHKILYEGTNKLGALIDSLSNSHIMKVEKIAFNQELLDSILEASPKSVREIVDRLGQGESLRMMIINGVLTPQEIESHLEDLARRGAIIDVLGQGEKDLVAEALRIRQQSPGTLIHSTPPPKGNDEQLDFLSVKKSTEDSAGGHPFGRVEAYPDLSSGQESGATVSIKDTEKDWGTPTAESGRDNEFGDEQWLEVDEASSHAASENRVDKEISGDHILNKEPQDEDAIPELRSDMELIPEEVDRPSKKISGTLIKEEVLNSATGVEVGQDKIGTPISDGSTRDGDSETQFVGYRKEKPPVTSIHQGIEETIRQSGVLQETEDKPKPLKPSFHPDDSREKLIRDENAQQDPSQSILSEPTDATEGEQPSESTDVTEGEQPSEPTDATEGEQPSEPTDATEGEQPSEPSGEPSEGEQLRTQEPLPHRRPSDHPIEGGPGLTDSSIEQKIDPKDGVVHQRQKEGSDTTAPLEQKKSDNSQSDTLHSSEELAALEKELIYNKKRGLRLSLLVILLFAVIYMGWKSLEFSSGISIKERWGSALTTKSVSDDPPPLAEDNLSPLGISTSDSAVRSAEDDPSQGEEIIDPQNTEDEEDLISDSDELGGSAEDGFGRLLPFIDQSRNIPTKVGQGLLVIEFDGSGTAPQVGIAGKKIGRAPINIALPEGRHEVTFERGDEMSFRYVVIHSGKTLVVQTPDYFEKSGN